MDNYILISGYSALELEEKVNTAPDGYEPLGGPAAFGEQLVQAMVERKRITVIRGLEIRINGEVADNGHLSESLDKVLAEMAKGYYG